MNTDFPLKAQDAIIGDVIIYPEMDMSRTGEPVYHTELPHANKECHANAFVPAELAEERYFQYGQCCPKWKTSIQ